MLPRLTLPPSPAVLAALAAAFILPGLASHDLWKTQDAIGLGIVHGMAVSRDIIVPRIAGEVWLYDQPLYHWFALAFGKLLGWLVEFHAAARLASGAFVGAAFVFIYAAAREGSREETRQTVACAALLVLLGCIGLLVHAHEALPELASLAAMCGALAALPYATRKPLRAGLAFGVALGMAFLSATWIAPLSLALVVVVAHFVCPEWRTQRSAPFLATTAAAALVVALSWPLALALRSPETFSAWRAIVFQPEANAAENFRHFFSTASWFTWPAWPLALWSAWSLRRRWREARLLVPALTVLAMIILFIAWGPPQDENLIPLLAPLALLAAQGIFTLRRGALAALDWFGALTFAVFAGLVWLGYIAMLTGLPAPVARNFGRIAPGFVAHLQPLAVAFALALVAAWLYIVFFTPGSPLRSLARWAGGVVLLWGTFAMLWMPWVDYQKSYRSVALQLKSKLPVDAKCLAQRSLGVSQAAALDYHGGIRTQPFDVVKPAACPLVLVQGSPKHELDAPATTAAMRWTKLADVGRPGDRAERYRLYRLEK
ncbi:MAG TPA: glycosyltransferase family 39 protein [Burkholderiales bacterium]